ncbi:hypothetical protein pb186bvf_020241 [Paramecium bursaria]
MMQTQQQNQDEAILSNRNDILDESNDEEENQEVDIGDDKLDEAQQEQQAFTSHEKNEKETKETCLEKIKGYLGFGSLLTSQKIGRVFFIPIPTKWTFKMQVIVTQIIIAIVSLGVFFGIRYLGQNIFKDIVKQWSENNFSQLQNSQIQQISSQYLGLIKITYQNEILFAKIMNDLFQQTDIYWPQNLTASMDKELPYATVVKSDIYDYITYNYSTYINLNNTNIDISTISRYLTVNYMMKYNYVTLKSTFYWIFNDGLMFQYPGINVTDIEAYKKYRKNIDEQHIISQNFIWDEYQKQYIQRQSLNILNSLNQTVGRVYIERTAQSFEDLFYLFAYSNMQNYTFLLIQEEQLFLNKSNIEYQDYIYTNLKQQNFFQLQNQTIKDFLITKGKINLTTYSVSQLQTTFYNFTLILVYPYTLLEQQIQQQDQDFNQYDQEFNQRYLAACIVAPLIYIIVVVLFLVREIKPLEEITQEADMQLRKSQNFRDDQKDIKGDDLISQLTMLFKKLMKNLEDTKKKNKDEIIQFYNKQTYPENKKERDVSLIRKEIEKLRQQEHEIPQSSQKLDNIQVKKIPNFED